MNDDDPAAVNRRDSHPPARPMARSGRDAHVASAPPALAAVSCRGIVRPALAPFLGVSRTRGNALGAALGIILGFATPAALSRAATPVAGLRVSVGCACLFRWLPDAQARVGGLSAMARTAPASLPLRPAAVPA